MGWRSLVVTGVAAAVVGALVPAAGVQAAALSCGGTMATTLNTFHVEAKARKKTYRLGATALIDMKVTRPAHEDPAGEGNQFDPPMSQAAENVNVSVGVYLGDFYMYGVGVTDENGEATLKVKLNPKADPGMARGEAAARAFYNRGGCPDIEEEGYAQYGKFFTATN